MEIKNSKKKVVEVSIACPEAGDVEYIPDMDKLKDNIKSVYRKLRRIDFDGIIKEVLHSTDNITELGFGSVLRINIIMICRAAVISNNSKDLNRIKKIIDEASMSLHTKQGWNYRYKHLRRAMEFKIGEI